MLHDLYIIGSLANDHVPLVARNLRAQGVRVFDDWKSAYKDADQILWDYYKTRGYDYREAINSPAARNVFEFDKTNLERSHGCLLVLPAGKSAHLELGYMAGRGRFTSVLLDGTPDRLDVMYGFVDHIFTSETELYEWYDRPPDSCRPSGLPKGKTGSQGCS